MIELDVELAGGRVLHVYDSGELGGSSAIEGSRPVVWHAGTPNIGTPPRPLFAAAARLGLRWVGYDRPGYGGSTPVPGRSVGSAAADVAAVADALGLDRFAVMGHSGGAAHALACAALLPDRVVAAVAGAGLAPFDAEGLDWFAGMAPAGAAKLRAMATGQAGFVADGEPAFTAADLEALAGPWGWFAEVVGPAVAAGPGPQVADDLAYVSAWGFDPASIRVPVLVLHGADDLVVPAAHGQYLAGQIPGCDLRLARGQGHISVLPAEAEAALAWLTRLARPTRWW